MPSYIYKFLACVILILLNACSHTPHTEVNSNKELNSNISNKEEKVTHYSKRELQKRLHQRILQADKFDVRPYITLLLDYGVDINGPSLDKALTALMLACKNTKTPANIFEFLIANGAKLDISIPENNASRPGITALHLCAGVDAIYSSNTTRKTSQASNYGNNKGYKILLANDANKYIKDQKGHSAYSVLRALGKRKLANLEAKSAKKHHELQKKNDAKRKVKFNTLWKRDLYLPPALRKKKYLSALLKRIKTKRYGEALVYFEFLHRMQIELTPDYVYYFGEALLNGDKPRQAITTLQKYIKITNATGKFSNNATAMITQAKKLFND